MGCFNSKHAPSDPLPAREVTKEKTPHGQPFRVPVISPSPPGQLFPVIPQDVRPSEPSSHADAGRGSPQVEEPQTRPQMREPARRRLRSKSTPERPSAMKGGEEFKLPQVPAPFPRSRAKSTGASSIRTRKPSTPTRIEHPRPPSRRQTLSNPSRRPLNSTVQQILPEHFKFRILVLGKRGSGKSSLIKAVFKVDVTARAPGKADIDVEFHPEDNRYLIVHESSGLDSQARDSHNLQAIQAFVSRRTDATCSPSERLHAIWICVPASDAVDGRLGDGVENFLALGNVPVILVLTKFDALVSKVGLDIPNGEPQARRHERARAGAYAMYKDLCRQIFHKEPRNVPAEIVSVKSRFIDLIENLVTTTDRFVTGSRASSSRAGGQGTSQQLDAVPLAWSAAVRVNHEIIIEASIAVGRRQYWLSICPAFKGRRLKDCVNIIHDDIVEIWNLKDKTGYLSSDKFKAKMSHLVKDLAGSDNATSSSDQTGTGDAHTVWVYRLYDGSKQESKRCVAGYIVDLMVILDGIFRMSAGDVSPDLAEQVFETHVNSGRRDAIHYDIRRFMKEAFAIKLHVPQKDLVLEKTIDLIKQFCDPCKVATNDVPTGTPKLRRRRAHSYAHRDSVSWV